MKRKCRARVMCNSCKWNRMRGSCLRRMLRLTSIYYNRSSKLLKWIPPNFTNSSLTWQSRCPKCSPKSSTNWFTLNVKSRVSDWRNKFSSCGLIIEGKIKRWHKWDVIWQNCSYKFYSTKKRNKCEKENHNKHQTINSNKTLELHSLIKCTKT